MRIPEHTANNVVILSPTRVEGGTKCIRKHLLSDVVSYQPSGKEDAAALEFGTRMHRATALLWTTGDALVGSEYLRAQRWPLNEKHTLGLALQCYATYVATARLFPYSDLGEPMEKWEAVAIEERVLLSVKPGLVLSFQLDRLVREQTTKKLALIDLKTAAKTDARWVRQWQRSLQMKLYSETVLQKYGQELDWLIIEGMSKDTAAITLVPVNPFSTGMRAEAWRSFEWIAFHDRQILDACTLPDGSIDVDRLVNRSLTEAPFNPNECFSYGSACDYLPLCDAEPEERIALFKEGYEYVEPEYV